MQCVGDSAGRAALVVDSSAAVLAARAAAMPPGSVSSRECSGQRAPRSSAEGQPGLMAARGQRMSGWLPGVGYSCAKVERAAPEAYCSAPGWRSAARASCRVCGGALSGEGRQTKVPSSPRITCLYVISPLYE